nr:immunoglobulin light chain junction region [Macaca mulatta]
DYYCSAWDTSLSAGSF